MLFRDNDDREGSVIPPSSVLRMKVEREEAPFCGIRFESKTRRHQAFDKWAGRVLALPEVKKLLNRVGVLKAIIRARLVAIEKNHVDLEFVMSP